MSKVTSRAGVHVCGNRWWGISGTVTTAAFVGLVLALPPSVQAETFNCAAGDVSCLIAAINEANTNGQRNTIRLEAGTYTLTDVDNDTDGSNGLPSITSHLTIRGAGADVTSIVRVSSAPEFRLIHVDTIAHLTVEAVSLTGGGLRIKGGGGLFNNGGVVNIARSTVSGNIGAGGGGIFNNGGVVNVSRSTVSGNVTLETGGGGLGNDGGGIVNITLSTFAGNFVAPGSSSGSGGLNTNGGAVRITKSRFTANRGQSFPGGIGGVGAGGGTVAITNATFDNNLGRTGGGIGTSPTTTLMVADSAFTENMGGELSFGAAIGNVGTAVVTNSTFSHNVMDSLNNGGAIANLGNLILFNSTLADNVAGPQSNSISGLFSETNATTILVNTILVRNSQDCRGPNISAGNNLIGDPTGCSITLQPSDLTGDPGLNTFRDNGRPGNGHFPLLPTSQAIDAGSDAVCPRTDQIGRQRIGPCDIGAIAFRDRDDRGAEAIDVGPTDGNASAPAQTEISVLVANLVQAVTTLKAASAGSDEIFNQLKSVLDRAGDPAWHGVSEGISTGK